MTEIIRKKHQTSKFLKDYIRLLRLFLYICSISLVKFTKRDDLDKMFEEFAKLPDLKQVTFPDDKEKKAKAEKKN